MLHGFIVTGLEAGPGIVLGESLESTVKRLLLFCDTFASAGDVIEVKTNFDKNLFLDAIKVEHPYIISLV